MTAYFRSRHKLRCRHGGSMGIFESGHFPNAKVLICYSQDSHWIAEELISLLKPLSPEIGQISADTIQVSLSSGQFQELKQVLSEARVVILLIHEDSLLFSLLDTESMESLLEVAQQQGALVLPVVVSFADISEKLIPIAKQVYTALGFKEPS